MTTSQQRPFTIRIYVPDGDPEGLRIVQKSLWTGVGIVFNRTNFKQAAARLEFDRTGVYVLVGASEESALPTIYVGEGDPVKDRLSQHYSKKDFWSWAVFFVTRDNSLNKAHVQRLEWKLLELARAAKSSRIDNATSPTAPSLSEADVGDVDNFVLDMLSIFPLLGLTAFDIPSQTIANREVLNLIAKGVTARAYEDAKGFVVLKNSRAHVDEVPSIHQYLSTLRRDLVEQGVLTR